VKWCSVRISEPGRFAAGLLPLAALLLVCVAGCNKQSQHAPDVWATVNGKEIKRDDVEKYYRTRVNPEGPPPSHEEALSLKLNVLDELINNEILTERAKKSNLEASDGEVEDKFTELKSPYTEDEFQRQLKERGVTVDDLKSDLRRQLSIQKLLNRIFIMPTRPSSMWRSRSTAWRRSWLPRAKSRKSATARMTTPPTKRKPSAK
jgi:peptidyl-prolyl cis-trans isomerase SurA